MNDSLKTLLIIAFLILIVWNLGAGLYYMLVDKSESKRTVNALTRRIAGLLGPPPSEGIARASPTVLADGSLLVIALQREALAQALSLPALAPRVLKLDPDLPLGYARDLDILPNTLPPERHVGYAVQWFGLAAAVFITALVLTWRSRRVGRQGR